MPAFMTTRLKAKYDYHAPDGSEVRKLTEVKGSNIAHITLPPQSITKAKVHKTVDEQWYFIQGVGEVWRKKGNTVETVDVNPGVAVTIPRGVRFQFRNNGWEPLCFICVDSPPWPEGVEEAVDVQGEWCPTVRE
jgi:mannose-6-phosphate isomerase-like protein (cupin superfamily)